MFKNILVPVDGSDQSLQSAKVAAALAGQNGKVHLIHVLRPYAFEYMGMEGKDVVVPGGATETAQKILDKIQEIIFVENMEITTEIAYGNPGKVIVEESKKGYDLIVMGSRGLGGLTEVMLGSVSNQVSHYARCPVLLTRLGKEDKKIIKEIYSVEKL